jgi:hypothetical protein
MRRVLLLAGAALAAGCASARANAPAPAPTNAAPATAAAARASDDSVYDVVIRNGRVLDGAGNPWILADVAIRGGRLPRAWARWKGAAAPRSTRAASTSRRAGST